MEIIIACIVIGLPLMFAALALDAARDRPRKDRPSEDKGV